MNLVEQYCEVKFVESLEPDFVMDEEIRKRLDKKWLTSRFEDHVSSTNDGIRLVRTLSPEKNTSEGRRKPLGGDEENL